MGENDDLYEDESIVWSEYSLPFIRCANCWICWPQRLTREIEGCVYCPECYEETFEKCDQCQNPTRKEHLVDYQDCDEDGEWYNRELCPVCSQQKGGEANDDGE